MQQALEKQIVFQDHKEAYSLLGERDEFLQVMRENFDCQFISRGDRIEILGEAAMVEPAAKVLEEMKNDMDTVALILKNMSSEAQGKVLAAMNSSFAASVTKKLVP